MDDQPPRVPSADFITSPPRNSNRPKTVSLFLGLKLSIRSLVTATGAAKVELANNTIAATQDGRNHFGKSERPSAC